ncbi:ferric siderophore ABC transporter substrate-binding protein [Chryseobacterium sp. Leaf180]|uniref:hypothetical protein n=1 Tax=Chryseobacterium sp. Leaf180 TaxID=1736289 RepID=UPI0006F9DD61|nr:hypothetical protein [Chryseobacterium sp. Leaf180]KQR95277.1 ferric siderophore ABC transporter substrate-binding protein [Chryseobacterium sp. Leaf180]
MRGYTINKNEENKDRIKSAVLSVAIWSAILLFVFIYKMKPSEHVKEAEIVTTMLVNFGDNRNGEGLEEPANQEGSLAAATEEPSETAEAAVTETRTALTEAQPEAKKSDAKEKIITGTNDKMKVAKKEDSKKESKTSSSSATKNTKSNAAKTNASNGRGDGRGNAAIGNLLNGRGKNPGNQGNGKGPGNLGDPLGGDGYGDSKIGINRGLTDFIPGTMGKGGTQPSHKCTAEGSVTIAYKVDKAGNVISASRSGGISDPCVVSTAVGWVKQYVKAERAPVSSTGTYKITF